MPLVHHELCFGCGRTNLFGLLLEVEETAPGEVAGRCFIKQDHQGPDRGSAHEGVVATALSEALGLAAGPAARVRTLAVDFAGPAPVGAFLTIEASVESGRSHAHASASLAGQTIATARATYR
jgi:acyl-coenzyme A thioesterase PaaI-like protein